ncbi:ABC transporter substrate-binding protein [Monashia sp. NPDC004114]
MRRRVARPVVVAAFGMLALVAAGCTTPDGSAPVGSETAAGVSTPLKPAPSPLVVETVFDHTSLDPSRTFNRSGAMLSKALYQTLTTLDPSDPTKVVPGLAEYTLSPEGKWLTMRLRKGLVFADGTPITSDDVIFTLERSKGRGGNAASILGTVNVTKVDDRTFTIASPGANFALPAILANPAYGILNSATVKANGGAIGPGDTSGTYFATHSAGSGPYVLSGVSARGELTLEANPNWSGDAPAFPRVVVRDATPQQQLADVTAGTADVALDLSPMQAAAIGSRPQQTPVTVTTMRSSTLAFLMLNRNKAVNQWTPNRDFDEAVRLGIDREALALASGDATPAAGLIPAGIVGALENGVVPTSPPPATAADPGATTGTPAPDATTGTSGTTGTGTGTPAPPTVGTTELPLVPERDVPAAKAALRRSGYHGQPIPLSYAADLPIEGIPPATLATLVKKQLAEIGITVTLAPKPAAQALADYRAGRSALSIWSWSPDYPDPENYLAFAPSELVGARAGWALGADPDIDDLTAAASASLGDDRASAYAAWQIAMNQRSPFVPLIQPYSHSASVERVHDLPGNPVWPLDLARVR